MSISGKILNKIIKKVLLLELWYFIIIFFHFYRPKDFEFRAVMEIIYFCITSNIISDISGANMRFILEECVISIAPQVNMQIILTKNT